MVVNMTQAKRYQGEALRGEAWRNMGRDKAWERKRAGARELQAILLGKFELYCETKFDPMECGYLIVTQISISTRTCKTEGMYVPFPNEVVLEHEEPALEFPSEHLKAKLLLIAG